MGLDSTQSQDMFPKKHRKTAPTPTQPPSAQLRCWMGETHTSSGLLTPLPCPFLPPPRVPSSPPLGAKLHLLPDGCPRTSISRREGQLRCPPARRATLHQSTGGPPGVTLSSRAQCVILLPQSSDPDKAGHGGKFESRMVFRKKMVIASAGGPRCSGVSAMEKSLCLGNLKPFLGRAFSSGILAPAENFSFSRNLPRGCPLYCQLSTATTHLPSHRAAGRRPSWPE